MPPRRGRRTLYDGGWAGITWPKEYGGRGGTAHRSSCIFDQEQAAFDVSARRVRRSASAWPARRSSPTAPTSRRSATSTRCSAATRCGASCSASPAPAPTSPACATRADARRRRVGRQRAEGVDLGCALQRLGHPARPHRPRRARSTGASPTSSSTCARPASRSGRCGRSPARAHFNEVFLTDVRIPAENVVGEVNGGWGVALTTLANERTLIGGGAGMARSADLLRLAERVRRGDDPVRPPGARRRATSGRAAALPRLPGADRAAAAATQPGPESSVMKLAYTRAHRRTSADLGDGDRRRRRDARRRRCAPRRRLAAAVPQPVGIRIGGGTDQVQRNIIGERVLGLPGDPAADKGVPFRELLA